MVMVFTLVSAGQEWLNEKWDSIKKDREEKSLAKKKADEEAEMVSSQFLFSLTNTFLNNDISYSQLFIYFFPYL